MDFLKKVKSVNWFAHFGKYAYLHQKQITMKKNLLKNGYNPTLSVEENARLNKCSIANVRKYIQVHCIDRRFDTKLTLWKLVNSFASNNPNTPISKAAKALKISPNTYKKYLGAAAPSQIDITKVSKFDLSKYNNVVKSVGSDADCLHGILKLYTKGRVDCDLTYSVGKMWSNSGLEHPYFKFDKYPQTDETIELTLDNLTRNIEPNSLDSVLFDLPFLYGDFDKDKLKIVERFSKFSTADELLQTNLELMIWSVFLLKPNGYLIVKTQNIKTLGKQLWVTDYLSEVANQTALEKVDEFIYYNNSKFGLSKFSQKQCSARKAHGYYLIFRKLTANQWQKRLEENENPFEE